MNGPGVAAASVKVGGRETDPTVSGKLAELIVDRQLRAPDRATLRYRDFDLAIVDGATFAIGGSLEIALGSAQETNVTSVFDGQITALEPTFDDDGATIVISALDRGHLLQRSQRTETYQETSYGEIARKLATRAKLEAGEIDDGLRLPFVQQSNETDWDFLWRLALEVDCHVVVRGRTLSFSPAAKLGAEPVTLVWGEELLAFAPRVTGVHQVEKVTVRGWDPKTATPIEASAPPPTAESRLNGVDRAKVVSALGGGSATVVDRPVTSQRHAETLAGSVAAQLASSFVEGDGSAIATPRLQAGAQLHVRGVGKTFSGTYLVTGVRHRFRSAQGFRTDFSISGRAHRTVLGLDHALGASGWERRIVVGVVNNIEDPEKLGRVRVKYPALDDGHEGWWARVVAPGSGATRGFFSLPRVNDEVLVVFEHGSDQHPFVLGSVFNGTNKPGEVVQNDGSFTLVTPHHITIDAAERAELAAGQSLALSGASARLTTKSADRQRSDSGGSSSSGAPPAGAIELDAEGGLKLTAQQSASVAGGTTATVSAKAHLTLSGGEVTIEANGPINVLGSAIAIAAEQTLTLSASEIILG